jgi:hypothetical protein
MSWSISIFINNTHTHSCWMVYRHENKANFVFLCICVPSLVQQFFSFTIAHIWILMHMHAQAIYTFNCMVVVWWWLSTLSMNERMNDTAVTTAQLLLLLLSPCLLLHHGWMMSWPFSLTTKLALHRYLARAYTNQSYIPASTRTTLIGGATKVETSGHFHPGSLLLTQTLFDMVTPTSIRFCLPSSPSVPAESCNRRRCRWKSVRCGRPWRHNRLYATRYDTVVVITAASAIVVTLTLPVTIPLFCPLSRGRRWIRNILFIWLH